MDTARIPYPSHPYQSSANLASMLIQNGLSGIRSYIEQDAPIFSGSIRDNLTMGTIKASDETCWNALKLVNLDTKVRNLEQELNTQVGEQGHFLSGGERQRLSIARTLLHRKPVILLDEPTSSLDSINQQKINALLREIFSEQTVIEVVHRMSTIEPGDQILVMEKGKIVARGTHDELKISSPAYRELLQMPTINQQTIDN